MSTTAELVIVISLVIVYVLTVLTGLVLIWSWIIDEIRERKNKDKEKKDHECKI